MGSMAALPANDPRLIAWDAYKATAEFANTRRWATDEAHADGSLWASFIAGFGASAPVHETAVKDALNRYWQPIDDAPRDGTLVDLWFADKRWTDFRWTGKGWSRTEGYPTFERRLLGQPTHFMPIPAEPA